MTDHIEIENQIVMENNNQQDKDENNLIIENKNKIKQKEAKEQKNVFDIIMMDILDDLYEGIHIRTNEKREKINLLLKENEKLKITHKFGPCNYGLIHYLCENNQTKKYFVNDHVITSKNTIKTISYLIDHYEYPINHRNFRGDNALIFSIIYNNKLLFDFLLQKNIDTGNLDCNKRSPLHIACIYNRIDMVKKLLNTEKCMNIINNYDSYTNPMSLPCPPYGGNALFKAIKTSNIELVDLLYNKKCDVQHLTRTYNNQILHQPKNNILMHALDVVSPYDITYDDYLMFSYFMDYIPVTKSLLTDKNNHGYNVIDTLLYYQSIVYKQEHVSSKSENIDFIYPVHTKNINDVNKTVLNEYHMRFCYLYTKKSTFKFTITITQGDTIHDINQKNKSVLDRNGLYLIDDYIDDMPLIGCYHILTAMLHSIYFYLQ